MLDLPASLLDGPPRLRPPAEQDVPRIVELCRDPDVARFTNVPVPYGTADAASFVAFAAGELERGTGVHLSVVDEADVVQGAVGMGVDLDDRSGTVGYWTAPAARGRGTTTEVTRRLCRFALEDLGLLRLELHAAASNAGSNAIARRLGFTLEGTLRSSFVLSAVGDLPEARDDECVWGLLPGELT